MKKQEMDVDSLKRTNRLRMEQENLSKIIQEEAVAKNESINKKVTQG